MLGVNGLKIAVTYGNWVAEGGEGGARGEWVDNCTIVRTHKCTERGKARLPNDTVTIQRGDYCYYTVIEEEIREVDGNECPEKLPHTGYGINQRIHCCSWPCHC